MRFNGSTVKGVYLRLDLGEGQTITYEVLDAQGWPMHTEAELRYAGPDAPAHIELKADGSLGEFLKFDADLRHLEVERSDRGFKFLPPIASSYPGGEVTVSESSAASWPSIWLRAKAPDNLNEPDGPSHEVPIHLTAGAAWRLAEQLQWLVRNHYQGYGLAALSDDEEGEGRG